MLLKETRYLRIRKVDGIKEGSEATGRWLAPKCFPVGCTQRATGGDFLSPDPFLLGNFRCWKWVALDPTSTAANKDVHTSTLLLGENDDQPHFLLLWKLIAEGEAEGIWIVRKNHNNRQDGQECLQGKWEERRKEEDAETRCMLIAQASISSSHSSYFSFFSFFSSPLILILTVVNQDYYLLEDEFDDMAS